MAFEKLEQLGTRMAEIQAAMTKMAQDEIKPALTEAVQFLKNQIPNLKTIEIVGYRPHFNDGDPCIWGLHWVGCTFLEDGSEMSAEDHDLSWLHVSVRNNFKADYSLTDYQIDLLKDFNASLQSLGDEGGILQLAFDNNNYGVKVIINVVTGSLETEDYNHD